MPDITSSFYKGLEVVSVVLIVMPEPVTTVVGAGLLGYARQRRMKRQQRISPRRRRNTFDSYYSYRMDMANNSTITLQVFPKRHGQLPLHSSKVTKLYYNPKAWGASRKAVNLGVKTNHPHFSRLQPTGLLGRRDSVSHARLYSHKHRLPLK